MGLIFSGAEKVNAWLGINPQTTTFFDFWTHASRSRSLEDFWKEVWDWKKIQICWRAFATDGYWSRAWITQEILLAKVLIFMTDEVEIQPRELKGNWWLPTYLLGKSPDVEWEVPEALIVKCLSILDKGCTPQTPLVKLIGDYPGRICQDPKDQVYSLLFLACDGDRISVDYRLQESEFCLQLIHAIQSSLCLCSLKCLTESMSAGITADPVFYMRFRDRRKSLRVRPRDLPWLEQEKLRLKASLSLVDQCSFCKEHVTSCTGHLFCLEEICPAKGGHFSLTQHTIDLDVHGNSTVTNLLMLHSSVIGASVMHMRLEHRMTSESVDKEIRSAGFGSWIGKQNSFEIGLEIREILHLVQEARRIHQSHSLTFKESTCPNAWENRGRLTSVPLVLTPTLHIYHSH